MTTSPAPGALMPAAVYLGGGDMAVREVRVPVPGPGEALWSGWSSCSQRVKQRSSRSNS